MPETVINSVGAGRDFADLAAFAAAVPADLTSVDQIWVAELYADNEDPGGAVLQTVCDATRYIVVRAAPGEGFADLMDPESDPLTSTPGLGAMILAGLAALLFAGSLFCGGVRR